MGSKSPSPLSNHPSSFRASPSGKERWQPTTPILQAKLSPPSPTQSVLQRTHLHQRLHHNATHPLGLVHAPAGSGKTTLLSTWLPQFEGKTAWLSLEPTDNEASRFLGYLLATLGTLQPEIESQFQPWLSAHQAIPTEVLLTSLLNALHQQTIDFVVVLDDYHFIEHPIIHQAVEFLMEHWPPHGHFCLLSRSIPDLPVARWQAKSRLSVLGPEAFPFQEQESREFTTRFPSLILSPQQQLTLHLHTEGWAAGLQLACLSLQGKSDLQSSLQQIHGTHRAISDYLVEEVFATQSPAVQHFLLCSSVVEQMNPSLIAALLDSTPTESQNTLQHLYRHSLFVITQDLENQWFRYHHLFRQWLYKELDLRLPSHKSQLHRRASQWYEEKGYLEEAVAHAFQLEDKDALFAQLLRCTPRMIDQGKLSTVEHWLQEVSPHLLQRSDQLSIHRWFVKSACGSLEEGEVLALQMLRRDLQEQATQATDEERAAIEDKIGQIAYILAYLQVASGYAMLETQALAKEATDKIAPTHGQLRHFAKLLYLSICAEFDEDYQQVEQEFQELKAQLIHSPKNSTLTIYTRFFSLSLATARGQFQEAEQGFQRELQPFPSSQRNPYTGLYHVGLGEIAYYRNELDQAHTHFQKALHTLQHVSERNYIVHSLLHLSLLHWHRRDTESALAYSAQIRTFQPSPELFHAADIVPFLHALSTQDQAALDAMLPQLHRSIESRRLGHEFTLKARLLHTRYLLQQQDPQVVDALVSLSQELSHSHLLPLRIEAQWLLGIAQHQHAFTSTVVQQTLAQAERWSQLGPFTRLLENDRELWQPIVLSLQTSPSTAATRAPSPPSWVKAPSKREHEILRLVSQGLTNRDIAQTLFISPATVKRHLSTLYNKLDVTSRTQAVARATRWGLLP